MNSGEIPVLRFEGAQGRAETVAAHLRIETAAQFVVINEKMGPVEPKRIVRLDLVQFWETAAHRFRECPLSATLSASTGILITRWITIVVPPSVDVRGLVLVVVVTDFRHVRFLSDRRLLGHRAACRAVQPRYHLGCGCSRGEWYPTRSRAVGAGSR
jgi:hypothetical protein